MSTQTDRGPGAESTPAPSVRSVNLAHARAAPEAPRTGIGKRPVAEIEVHDPAGGHGAGSGVLGDHVGNSRHHGGSDKAVYAFAREELDWWEGEVVRALPDGTFGENLTTIGLTLEDLLINQRLRVGDDVLLEVSVPRQPCATFQRHMGEAGWTRRFTARGRCGAYLRVLAPGRIRAGDGIEVLPPPEHDIDMRLAFAAAMGDQEAAARVVSAGCLPTRYHEQLVHRLTARQRR